MCVIMVANQNVRPTEEMIRQGWEKNPEGGGYAYQENGIVKWKKGQTLEQMIEANQKLPFPYVLHFRIASPNTDKMAGSNHPFPIEGKVSRALEGSTKIGVLFHNGFWANWKDNLKSYATASRFRLPGGAWTDTRGLAWVTAHFGMGMLELIDEKVIVMTPKFIHTFGNGWTIVNDVIVSNEAWKKHTPYHQTPPASMAGNPNRAGGHGPVAGASFRGQGQAALGPTGSTQRGPAEQESVQETAQGSGVQGPSQVAATVTEGGLVALRDVERFRAGLPHSDALNAFEWARAQNPNPFKRNGSGAAPATVLGGITYPLSTEHKCLNCPKDEVAQPADIFEHGNRFCWSCWDKRQVARFEAATAPGSQVAVLEMLVEKTCEFCNNNRAIQQTKSTNQWMCNACWVSKHRPLLHPARMSQTPLANAPGGSTH